MLTGDVIKPLAIPVSVPSRPRDRVYAWLTFKLGLSGESIGPEL